MKAKTDQPRHNTLRAGTNGVAGRRRSLAEFGRPKPHSDLTRLRRILVPLDFSGKSRQALQYALPLASAVGARIILLHVLKRNYTLGEASFAYLPLDTAPLIKEAKARLRSMAIQLKSPDLIEKMIVRVGIPYDEITAAARRLKADLIVIATHGYTGLTHVLLGSTAERVVRHAPCPVLTVRRR
jgi:nucleotide-binding universal stress UspA family protein